MRWTGLSPRLALLVFAQLVACARANDVNTDAAGDSDSSRLYFTDGIHDRFGLRDAPADERGCDQALSDTGSQDLGSRDTGTRDTGSRDTAQPDSGSGPCSPWTGTWTLETPVHLPKISSPGREWNPFVSADGLTIYFGSDRPPGSPTHRLIYTATRASLQDDFDNVQQLTWTVEGATSESAFALSADGLSAFIASDRSGTIGKSDLWRASRTAPGVAFGAFANLTALNTTGDEFDPFPSSSGKQLFFVSYDLPGVIGGSDIFVADWNSSTKTYYNVSPVTALNSTMSEGNLNLSSDGLVAVFASTRSGGPGSVNLWYSVRASIGKAFPAPQLLPVVNGAQSTAEPYLTPDGCTLYFTSDKAGGLGQTDFYRTRFKRP